MPSKPPTAAKNAQARAYNFFNMVTFTIAAEAAHVIKVTVQLKDARANLPAGVCRCHVYLSDNADGSTLTATVTTSALAIAALGVLELISVTGKAGDILTNATGAFDINITQTAAKTYYLCIVMPDGSVVVSGAIVHAG